MAVTAIFGWRVGGGEAAPHGPGGATVYGLLFAVHGFRLVGEPHRYTGDGFWPLRTHQRVDEYSAYITENPIEGAKDLTTYNFKKRPILKL